jgi:cytochrome c1
MNTIRPLFAASLLLTLGACQTGQGGAPMPAQAAPAPDFVQAACGDCHAVAQGWKSPNPAAPSFVTIANRKKLSATALSIWLRDAHNYPEAMDFDLDDARAKELADYIVTLREPEG